MNITAIITAVVVVAGLGLLLGLFLGAAGIWFKVDVDENQELALANKVVSIPTFLLYKDGEVIKKIVGAVPKSELIQAIRQFQ